MMIRSKYVQRNNFNGFTLIELIIVISIIGILASITVPVFSSWLPEYRLRNRVLTLFSDMHLAKIKAIKENSLCRIEFLPGSTDSYRLLDSDGSIIKTVTLCETDSDCSVGFGCGNATKSATVSGGALPEDGISYNSNKATFNHQGLGSSGYVYISNSKGKAYAIGTWSTGIIVMKKWNEITQSWE